MSDGRFVGECYRCKSEIWLPTALYEACKHSSKHSFFCPYGHEQIFAEGETEATKLRRERDRLAQQLAEKDDSIRFWIGTADQLRVEKGKLLTEKRKLTKRASAGICACCNRQFQDMARHMATKHPEFVKFERSMFKAETA